MKSQKDLSSRLTIVSPCQESWDTMAGGASERHCTRCDQQVFDFRRMTEREIEALAQASGSRLCARISRSADGRMLTLPPRFERMAPAAPSSWNSHRASPLAAAVVSAVLGLGTASAGPLPSEARASNASPAEAHPQKSKEQHDLTVTATQAAMSGQVTDSERTPIPGVTIRARNVKNGRIAWAVTDEKGRFTFSALDAGRYDLEASIEGFEVETRQALRLRPGQAREVNFVIRTSEREVITVTGRVCYVPER